MCEYFKSCSNSAKWFEKFNRSESFAEWCQVRLSASVHHSDIFFPAILRVQHFNNKVAKESKCSSIRVAITTNKNNSSNAVKEKTKLKTFLKPAHKHHKSFDPANTQQTLDLFVQPQTHTQTPRRSNEMRINSFPSHDQQLIRSAVLEEIINSFFQPLRYCGRCTANELSEKRLYYT